MVSNGPIVLFTFGVFVGPITSEFGWPRATLAMGVVAAHTMGAILLPFVGGLIDRFGARFITLTAVLSFCVVLAGLSFLPDRPWMFVAGYALLGICGAGHSPLPYTRAVSTWFKRKRGFAFGVTLSGVGIGTALMPQIGRALVGSVGWRGAYLGLACAVLVVAAPAVMFLVRDRDHDPTMAGAPSEELASGASLAEAMRTFRFWSIAIALLLVAVAVNGTLAHVVPMLTDRGISAQAATAALSATGVALILGRLISGYCLDRFYAPYVSAIFFFVPLSGVALLATGSTGLPALAAAVLLGIGIGAEVDIMAYLTGRYFGLKHFGAIYGILLALFTFGSGFGPWIIAVSYDHLHAYTVALTAAGVALLVAAGLVVRLGPYRYT